MPHLTGREALAEAFKRVNDRVARDDRGLYEFFGLPMLDRFALGVDHGELALLAGRPGVGKSALVRHAALHRVSRGEGVIFVSPGTAPRKVMLAMTYTKAGVDLSKARTDLLSKADWDALVTAAGEMADAQVLLDGYARHTIATLEESVTEMVRKVRETSNVGMVAVDYCQMLHGDGRYRTRYEEVCEVSRRLKALAVTLDVRVLAVSQLNRNFARRGDTSEDQPELWDLRDSGSLEDDADLVIALHNLDEEEQLSRRRISARVLKNRAGASRTTSVIVLNPRTAAFWEEEGGP